MDVRGLPAPGASESLFARSHHPIQERISQRKAGGAHSTPQLPFRIESRGSAFQLLRVAPRQLVSSVAREHQRAGVEADRRSTRCILLRLSRVLLLALRLVT